MSIIHGIIPYDIAGINNMYVYQNYNGKGIFSVGWDRYSYEYQTLIKFHTEELPQGINIVNVSLSINTQAGTPMQLCGYPITSPWNTYDVCWQTVPSYDINNPVIQRMVNHDTYYTFDITNLIEQWILKPDTNYGILLSGENACRNTFVNMQVDPTANIGIRVLVEYEIIRNSPLISYQIIDDIDISGSGEYFTTPRDLSSMLNASYFILNNTNQTVDVKLQTSPDLLTYLDEVLTEEIAPNQSVVIAPMNYGKYYRVNISVDDSSALGNVQTWLNVVTLGQ